MCLAEDQRPVERFLPQGADHLLADRVRLGACGGLLSTRMPASANTASNASVNCPPRSLMMKLQAAGTFGRVHQEVGGCLGGPGGVGVRGDSKQAGAPGTVPDQDQGVDAREQDADHMGEVEREDAVGLGA